MSIRFSAIYQISAALLLRLLSAAFVTFLAVSQPWLGLNLIAAEDGMRVSVQTDATGPSAAMREGGRLVQGIGQDGRARMTLNPLDLTEEPDTLSTSEARAQFYERQQALFNILCGTTVSLTFQSQQNDVQTLAVQPLPKRPFTDLPLPFWVQIMVGVISLLLAAWVVSQTNADPAGRIAFALACTGLWLCTHAAALYSTRELALNVSEFKTASMLNYIGSFVGGIGLVNLLLVCPSRIARPWQLWIAPLVILPIALMSLANLEGLAVSRQVTVTLITLAFVALVIVQTIKCWRDPVVRVVMTWLGISVIICAGGYIVAIIIPAFTGQAQKMTQAHAFAIILIFYIALGVAVARYRL